MTSIEIEDITVVVAVALMHAFQIASNARLVGNARRKFKVTPPEMNGPPEFMRTVRVQQNDLEFAVTFQVLLWTCGICFNQVVAGVLGLAYIYARRQYAKGYIEAAEKRNSGFHLSVNVIQLLLVFCIAGLFKIWIQQFLGVDLAAILKEKVNQALTSKTEL